MFGPRRLSSAAESAQCSAPEGYVRPPKVAWFCMQFRQPKLRWSVSCACSSVRGLARCSPPDHDQRLGHVSHDSSASFYQLRQKVGRDLSELNVFERKEEL